jgi:hypothetical protein
MDPLQNYITKGHYPGWECRGPCQFQYFGLFSQPD